MFFIDWYANDFPNNNLANHILHTINDSFSPTATGAVRIIKGTGFLYENLNGVRYRISPFSFFQVNPLQAENLVKKVIEFSEPKDKIIWDLYSGAGTFSLPLARESKFVFGIESNSEAVEDARLNAELNQIDNVVFYAKDLHSKDITKELLKLEKPGTVVIDPPRTGLHKNLLKALLNILPQRIVYVSCNPATLARDLFELKNFYKVKEIQPVDMFPQTYHTETVSFLELMNG
jgi:23S rRNA (uracil1939-C5)-methyltransferase